MRITKAWREQRGEQVHYHSYDDVTCWRTDGDVMTDWEVKEMEALNESEREIDYPPSMQ